LYIKIEPGRREARFVDGGGYVPDQLRVGTHAKAKQCREHAVERLGYQIASIRGVTLHGVG